MTLFHCSGCVLPFLFRSLIRTLSFAVKTLAEIEAGGKFLRDYLKRSAELFRAEVERVKALPGVNGTPFANHFLTWVLSTPFCNAAMWDNIAAAKWQISLQAATTAMGRVRAEL